MNSDGSTVEHLLADEAAQNRIIDLQLKLADKSNQLNKAIHDLRNPLSAINLNLRLLNLSIEANKSDRSEELVERLAKNTQSIKLQIDTLYDANAGSDDGLTLSMEPVDVNQLVTELAEKYAPYALSRSLEIIVQQSSGSALVHADRLMLSRSFENLVSNAIELSISGQPVKLVVRTSDTAIFVDICSAGQGLSQAELEQVFGRNQQNPSLFVAQQLVLAMEGKISAESPGKDQGATFSISLKPAPKSAPSPQ